ncbi:cupin [Nonomuraea sp. LP-02]|uniref:cupin n=1 Tax=Nonomuraea sp. LP-02 TaxID=3097960 RepID=UPI002E326D79|nr:cupin [Nonomuraea sp. LP-02]MED7931373.1 cupin [Nonomuraea sp. LP-02]
MTVTPIELSASGIQLSRGGRIRVGARPADAGRDGWHLKAFHARTGADVHADHWHVNTEADEIVSCIIGKIRLYLRPQPPGRQGEGEEEIRLTAGTAAIVPRGRWHRIQLDIPSTVMTITAPCGGSSERRADPL